MCKLELKFDEFGSKSHDEWYLRGKDYGIVDRKNGINWGSVE